MPLGQGCVDDGAQTSGRGLDVLRHEDVRDRGDAVGAGRDHRRRVAVVDAGDAAALDTPSGERLAFSTDSYVVQPLRFPGGSIGHVAVHGTVNDLAVSGARPRWLSAGFVIEEGFPIAELREIVADMSEAAAKAGVQIVTGDTKVVGKGAADVQEQLLRLDDLRQKRENLMKSLKSLEEEITELQKLAK